MKENRSKIEKYRERLTVPEKLTNKQLRTLQRRVDCSDSNRPLFSMDMFVPTFFVAAACYITYMLANPDIQNFQLHVLRRGKPKLKKIAGICGHFISINETHRICRACAFVAFKRICHLKTECNTCKDANHSLLNNRRQRQVSKTDIRMSTLGSRYEARRYLERIAYLEGYLWALVYSFKFDLHLKALKQVRENLASIYAMHENENGLPLTMATSDQQSTDEREIFPEFTEGTFMSRAYAVSTSEKALEVLERKNTDERRQKEEFFSLHTLPKEFFIKDPETVMCKVLADAREHGYQSARLSTHAHYYDLMIDRKIGEHNFVNSLFKL